MQPVMWSDPGTATGCRNEAQSLFVPATAPTLMDTPPVNRLRARLTCSFQGRDHDLDTLIDLDAQLARLHDQEEGPDFHRLLAQAAGIDTYSYLYEVVEASDIAFSEATGLAAACCGADRFDWQRFRQVCREDMERRVLAPIAAQHLGVADLEQRPDLKAALLAAYRAGRAATRD